MSQIIHLKKLIDADSAVIRNLGRLVFGKIQEMDRKQPIFLDLSGIRDISRAFAHELLVIEDDCRRDGIEFEIINLTSNLSELLNVVQKSCQAVRCERPELLPREVALEEAARLFDSELHI